MGASIKHSSVADNSFSATGKTNWEAEHSVSGLLVASNNLSDLSDIPTALANLGAGTVTSVSVTPNAGVSAVVANPTTTPALTFTLGAITPTSINTGSGAISGGTFTATSIADTGPVTIDLGTITTLIKPLSITETRNNAAVNFQGITYTITDTASGGNSQIWRILGGAAGTTNLLTVTRNGGLQTGSDLVVNGAIKGDGVYGTQAATGNAFDGTKYYHGSGGIDVWGTTQFAADTGISRVSAGVIGIGTGAAASVAGSLNVSAVDSGAASNLSLKYNGSIKAAASSTGFDITGAATVSTTLAVTGHTTFEGVTSTGATGTGKLVYDGTPTLVTPNIGAATGTSLSVTTTLKPGGYTVGTLPTGVTGAKAYVTDALAPSFLTTLVGGGAAYSGAQYSGAAWVAD